MTVKAKYSKMRILLAIIIFLLILLAVLVAGSKTPFGVVLEKDQPQTMQAVETQLITYQASYKYQRKFIGQVEAKQTAQLGFEIGGTVNRIYYDEGDVVQQHTALATLDISRLQAQQKEANASLTRAKAAAQLAAITYKRVSEIHAKNAVSAQEKDEAKEAQQTADAAVSVAQAQLDRINVDIVKSTLFAPFHGTIIHRMVDEGAVINAGQKVLAIQQNSQYDVRIGVSNKAAKQLKVGAEKVLHINDKKYPAKVSAILPVRSRARTVDVILTLQEQSTDIRPGDIARMVLTYDVPQRGFWLPIVALKEGERGLWSVYVMKNDDGIMRAERRSVEVYYTSNQRAFVAGAVNNGESVIVKGAAKLVPGQRV